MSSLSTPVRTSSDDEIVPESLLVTPPRSPRFMPISANRTAEIEFSEEFNSFEDELELVEEKSEHSEAKSQPAVTLHVPTEISDEVAALHLRLGQDEQRIAKLEQQVATMKDDKRKWEENPGGSSGQQQRKRQKTVNVYAAGPDVKKKYKGKKPHCNRCNRHHTGHCGTPCGKCKRYGHQAEGCRSTTPTVKPTATPGTQRICYKCGPQCGKCGRVGHLTKDCRVKAPVNNQIVRSANKQENPKACYECGGIGHFKAQCGNLKNQNKNKKNSTRGTNE